MTRSTKTHIVLSLVAACLMLATPAASEPPDDRSGPQQKPERRKEMLEKIRMVRMYSLTEALELDEATAAKLFPYLRKHDSSLEQLQDSKRKHHKALRAMVNSDQFDEKAADKHLDAISQAQVEIAKTESTQLEGLKRILTTEQRVKFVFARIQFERKVREMIREERRRKRSQRRERHEGERPHRDRAPPAGP